MANEKRDESNDVWVLGNWCGQYILRQDSSDELKRSSAHYVPFCELEAAQKRIGLARYEPAVPRCKTCKWYIDNEPIKLYRCDYWQADMHVPIDGSGYCHNHSELTQ
jgi:hypothetical protein